MKKFLILTHLEAEQGTADHSLPGTRLALQVPRQGLAPRAAPPLAHHQPEIAWSQLVLPSPAPPPPLLLR